MRLSRPDLEPDAEFDADDADEPAPHVLRYDGDWASSGEVSAREPLPPHVPTSANQVLGAFHDISRKINDLARELKCLGYFDDPDDRPRAA